MIAVYIKDGRCLKFNLPDEQKLVDAWRAMGNDPKYAANNFKFTVDGVPQLVPLGAIKAVVPMQDAQFTPVLEEVPA